MDNEGEGNSAPGWNQIRTLAAGFMGVEKGRLQAPWLPSLERIIEKIRAHKETLEGIKKMGVCLEPYCLHAFFEENKGIDFLATYWNQLKESAVCTSNDIIRCLYIYDAAGARQEKAGENTLEEVGAHIGSLEEAHYVVQKLFQSYVALKKNVIPALDNMEKAVAGYNRYLRQRFVKSDEPQTADREKIMMTPFGPLLLEPPVKYVKMKFIEGNPLLSDVLLGFYEHLPAPEEKRVKSTRKRVREVPLSAVHDVAVRLDVLGDPQLLPYLKDTKNFFADVTNTFTRFWIAYEDIDTEMKELLKYGTVIGHNGIFSLEELQEKNDKVLYRLAVLQHIGLDSLPQRDEDVLPDNRKEKEFFALREKAITLMYEAIQELASLENGTINHALRWGIAQRAAESLIKLKGEGNDLLASYRDRKLRRDKEKDNEFYIGRQGEIGRFHFQREAAPNVKMEDVIGTSFDQAKKHLDEIINTGEFPHLMRLSAPGGRVRSNILLIGPFGCGKTELARAVCSDPRVIGGSVSVASTLTAYMHESVNNVKRVYDAAKDLRLDARELKPVALILDEFDGWFAKGDIPSHSGVDMQQIENILLEVLDGMEDYTGIITIAMTNQPKEIPKGIVRRFRYVDIVGELTNEERANMLKMYLERTLPVHEDVHKDIANHYGRWAERLADAPGDVVRKVVDEIHFVLLPDYIKEHRKEATRVEQVLRKREMNEGVLDDADIRYVKSKLAKYRPVSPADVERSIDYLLQKPNIRSQIDTARKVYRDAKLLLEELSVGQRGFGLTRQSGLYER